ncbi:hypothetical protein KDL01_38095 [Actinospica durhamensis]|uniref:Secreted protein n=1 Tax=Actinospica durhamensis TaxID=1508375 RepID=A0A941EZ41_9ACTN|nr:hypothetical protein [Actinospica durhamensis]MBR7839137.1 hypothetical protein [Actinospica durhamensis]
MGLIVAIVVILVLAAAGFWLVRYSPWNSQAEQWLNSTYSTVNARLATRFSRSGRDREKLQRKYGREYDRMLAYHGADHAAVEREIERRERERQALMINPLDPDERTRLTTSWQAAQSGFVDDPGASARSAEQLIGDALSSRGYPVGDPEQQLALASVDHAHSLAEFRDGHDLLTRSHSGAPGVDSTEQLRQAMLHFRVFFEELTGDTNADSGSSRRQPAAIAGADSGGEQQDQEALV